MTNNETPRDTEKHRQTDITFIDVNYIVFCQNIKYIYKVIKANFHGINSYIIILAIV